jgi:hypothetical protein
VYGSYRIGNLDKEKIKENFTFFFGEYDIYDVVILFTTPFKKSLKFELFDDEIFISLYIDVIRETFP